MQRFFVTFWLERVKLSGGRTLIRISSGDELRWLLIKTDYEKPMLAGTRSRLKRKP